MVFTITMLYDDVVAPIGDTTSEINRQYAQTNGYKFVCHRQKLDPSLKAEWNKMDVLLREIDTCDWVVWIDSDAIFVNSDRKLEEIVSKATSAGTNMLVSQDSNGLCTGLFLLKNCEWSKSLLSAWKFVGTLKPEAYRRFSDRPLLDQNTLKALAADFSNVSEHIESIGEDDVQNPGSGYRSTALAMHYWFTGLGRHSDSIQRCLQAFKAEGKYTSACHNF